jgi:hypothetical protein
MRRSACHLPAARLRGSFLHWRSRTDNSPRLQAASVGLLDCLAASSSRARVSRIFFTARAPDSDLSLAFAARVSRTS